MRAFLNVVAADAASRLRGAQLQEVAVKDGYIHRVKDPSIRERYADILGRHGLAEIAARGQVKQTAEGTMVPTGAFAAHFVEVRVDKDLGLLRVARVVTAVDAGRVLNEKTARSQIMGATVMGIGMTLFEETLFEPRSGRIAKRHVRRLLDSGECGRSRSRHRLCGRAGQVRTRRDEGRR